MSPILFLQQHRFPPSRASFHFLLSLSLSFFFLELLKNSFFNIFPEAPTFLRLLRGTKTQKELSILDQGWFLKHFPFQTPIYPEKCLVRRRPPGALGGRGLREHNPCPQSILQCIVKDKYWRHNQYLSHFSSVPGLAAMSPA